MSVAEAMTGELNIQGEREMKLIRKMLAIGIAYVLFSTGALAQTGFNLNLGGQGGCELLINGQDVGGCISSFTRPFQFGNDISTLSYLTE